MENFNWYWLAFPAFIALALKILFLHYARKATVANEMLHFYILLVFFLAIQNIVEISHFYKLSIGSLPVFEATVFYIAIVLACASFFALSVHTSFVKAPVWTKKAVRIIYAAAIVFAVLIASTSWLIAGFEPIGYTVTRIPGPGLFALELFVVVSLGSSFLFLAYGAIYPETPRRQMMNVYMFVAMAPLAITGVVVFALLHMGIQVNATILGPIATSFFLALTLYAVTAHKYFFELGLPSRRSFHSRLMRLIKELPRYQTVPKAIDAIGSNLSCTAALLDHGPPIVSTNRRSGVRYTELAPEFQAPFEPNFTPTEGRLVFLDGLWDQIVTRKDHGLLRKLIDRFNSVFSAQLCTEEVERLEQQQRNQLIAQAIEKAVLPEHIAKNYLFSSTQSNASDVDKFLNDVESAIYKRAIDDCAGNLTKAAQKLGVSNTTFHYRLRKHGIPTPNPKRQSRYMRH